MTHSERLPECEAFQCNMKETVGKHIDESIPVRADVEKSKNQILTLEKAHEACMIDIADIKKDIVVIKQEIRDLSGDVKIWVLSGVVGTVVAFAIPTMTLFYNAGQMSKQLELNTKKWEVLEAHK